MHEVLQGGVELTGDRVVLLRDVEHRLRGGGDAIGFVELPLQEVAHGARVEGDVLERGGDAAAGLRLLVGRFLHLTGDLAHLLRFLSEELRAARLFARGAIDLGDVIGHPRRHFVQMPARLGLIVERARDLRRHLVRRRRAADDLRQRLRRLARELHVVAHLRHAFVHSLHGLTRSVLHGLDDVGDLLRRSARAVGELADLVGDDGESRAVLARLRGDDRGVEREKVRAAGDLLDHVEDLADLTDAALQLVERLRGARRQLVGEIDSFQRACNRVAAGLRVFANLPRDLGRRLRRLPQFFDRRVHLRDERQHFVADAGEDVGAIRHLAHRRVHLRRR